MGLLHWEVPKGNLALGSVPSGARPPCPTLTWGWAVFPPVGTVPLRLRRSPVLRHRTKHESLSEMEGEPGPTSDAKGEMLPSLLKQVLGYQGFPYAYASTCDLCRCHAAGLAPCRAGGAAGWHRH